MLMLIAYHASAQETPIFDIGVKAGANGSFIRNITGDFESDGMKLGFVGGVWGRVKIPLIGLYVQPELVISQTGGKFESQGIDGNNNSILLETTANLTNLDAVVLIGQRFGLGPLALRLNLGPVYSNVLSAKFKNDSDAPGFEETTQDLKEVISSPQFGLQLGVGVDISKFNIDLRFQQNFTKLYDQDLVNEDARISALQLTLAYKIL